MEPENGPLEGGFPLQPSGFPFLWGAEAEQAELAWQPTTSSAAAPRVVREGTPPAMFKYNLRHWVLINWTGSDPPVTWRLFVTYSSHVKPADMCGGFTV